MKAIIYLLLLPLAACHNKNVKEVSKSDSVVKIAKTRGQSTATLFKPYRLVDDYYVTDTGYFNITIGDGIYAVVKKNDKLIDTIDLGYGIKSIDEKRYMYYTILGEGRAGKGDANPRYNKSIMASLGNYTIIVNDRKELIHNLTSDFDDYFSSPAIINHRIYYWQIKKTDSSGRVRISAAEFNPISKKTISHFIMTDAMETDASNYLPQPYYKSNTIYFSTGRDSLIKFSKDFKLYN